MGFEDGCLGVWNFTVLLGLHSGVEVTSHWQKDLSFFKPHEHIRLDCGDLPGACAFSFDPHC